MVMRPKEMIEATLAQWLIAPSCTLSRQHFGVAFSRQKAHQVWCAFFFEGEALSLECRGKDHSVNYVHDTIAAQDIGLNDLSTGYGDAI
jgi:hypothetical protein